MKSGSPVVGEVVRDHMSMSTKYYVRDTSGMNCYALLADSTDLFPKPQMNRQTTLHCADGRKGTAILSANQFRNQVTMIFKAPGGQEGVVTFGN